MTATFQCKMFERRNYELNACYNCHYLLTTTIVKEWEWDQPSHSSNGLVWWSDLEKIFGTYMMFYVCGASYWVNAMIYYRASRKMEVGTVVVNSCATVDVLGNFDVLPMMLWSDVVDGRVTSRDNVLPCRCCIMIKSVTCTTTHIQRIGKMS